MASLENYAIYEEIIGGTPAGKQYYKKIAVQHAITNDLPKHSMVVHHGDYGSASIRYEKLSDAIKIHIEIDDDTESETRIPRLAAILKTSLNDPFYYNTITDFNIGSYDYMEILPVNLRTPKHMGTSKYTYGETDIPIFGSKSRQGNPFKHLGSQSWIHPKTGLLFSTILRDYCTDFRFGLASDNDQVDPKGFCGFGHSVICQTYVDGKVFHNKTLIAQGAGSAVHLKYEKGVPYLVCYGQSGFNFGNTVTITKAICKYDANIDPIKDQVPGFTPIDHYEITGNNIRFPTDHLYNGSNMVTNRDGDKTIFFIEEGIRHTRSRSDRSWKVFTISDSTVFGKMQIQNVKTIESGSVNKYNVDSSSVKIDISQQGPRSLFYCDGNANVWAVGGNQRTFGSSSSGAKRDYSIDIEFEYKNMIGVGYDRVTDKQIIAYTQEKLSSNGTATVSDDSNGYSAHNENYDPATYNAPQSPSASLGQGSSTFYSKKAHDISLQYSPYVVGISSLQGYKMDLSESYVRETSSTTNTIYYGIDGQHVSNSYSDSIQYKYRKALIHVECLDLCLGLFLVKEDVIEGTDTYTPTRTEVNTISNDPLTMTVDVVTAGEPSPISTQSKYIFHDKEGDKLITKATGEYIWSLEFSSFTSSTKSESAVNDAESEATYLEESNLTPEDLGCKSHDEPIPMANCTQASCCGAWWGTVESCHDVFFSKEPTVKNKWVG